jgi:hypothetical protein
VAVCGSADGSVRTHGAMRATVIYICMNHYCSLCNNHSDIVARRHTSTRMYTYVLRKNNSDDYYCSPNLCFAFEYMLSN